MNSVSFQKHRDLKYRCGQLLSRIQVTSSCHGSFVSFLSRVAVTPQNALTSHSVGELSRDVSLSLS